MTNPNEVTDEEVIYALMVFEGAYIPSVGQLAKMRRALEQFAQSRSATSDAAMLDWMLANRNHRVQGNDNTGWAVLDCNNGIVIVVRNASTAREAIDAAIAAGGSQNG